MFLQFTAPAGLALALSLAVPAATRAQQPHAGHGAAPAPSSTASAPVPTKPGTAPARTGAYRSAFEGYQGFSDAKPVPWREANDNVARIGGWRAYAREAAGATTDAKPDASSNAGGGHGAHRRP